MNHLTSTGWRRLAASLAVLAFAGSETGFAQTPQASPAVQQNEPRSSQTRSWADKPADISFKPVDFYSEGVRLSGQVIYLASNEGKRLPAIVSATGWGGTANSFRSQSVAFARAGYSVFLFDYRGWGGSDGRLVLAGAAGLTSPPPAQASANARDLPGAASPSSASFSANVRELRGYVDPWEQTTDWFNAISYVAAQPWADADRIGIRGASFSGGHVVYVAAHDRRVKAVASLIGAFDGAPENWIVEGVDSAKVTRDRETLEGRVATGDWEAYPKPGQRTYSGLSGNVPGAKLTRWDAADAADRVTAPTLFVLAGKEELFENSKNGLRACNAVKGPRKMLLVPDVYHYDIYGIENDLATKATIDWYDKYLLPQGQSTRAVRDKVTLPKEPERGSCSAPFVRTPGSERAPGPGRGYRGPPR